MRKLIILTVLFFALILLSTSVLAINFNSLFTSLFDYFFPSPPKIISAKVEPIKVEPSDWMEIIAEVEDKYGVKSVFADMASIERVELKLIYGDEKKGVWKGKWFVHSIEVGKSYNATIVVINEREKTSNVNVEFHDDPVFCYRRMVNITGSQGWAYRKPVIIDNTQNSNTLTNYQVLVNLDTASLISQGKMRSDCGDIRFTDSDGVTLLSYWVEPDTCNTTNTKIWVKVPSIPASSTKTIYVYYGNPSAASASNGNAVFEFFDDFSTDTLSNYDHLTGLGWHPIPYGIAGSCTFSYDATNKRVNVNCPDDYMSALSPKTTLLPDMADLRVRLRLLVSSFSDSNAGLSIHVRYSDISNSYYVALSNDAGESELGKRVGGTDTVLAETNFAASANVIYTLEFRIAGSNLEYVRDGSVVASAVDTSLTTAGRVLIYPSEMVGWIDDIIVTKYTSPEPITIVGNEELPPIAVVTLDTQTLISQGKMRLDCGDIRFTDSRSFDAALWTRNFSYQLVSGCNSTNTLFRVNVTPISPITIGKTFYVYYGNPEVTSASTTVGLGNLTTTLLPEETWIRISGGTANLLITGGEGNLKIK